MTWTDKDTAEVARRRRERHRKRLEKLEDMRRKARKEATRLAAEISKADPAVRKIWGFGSVFEEYRSFREDSDIDLAGEGGSLAAWLICERSSWKVDWVELDDQDEAFAEGIRKKGILLYERCG